MKHTLKIQDRFYKQILTWEKTFEIRKNDRDFKVWDVIEFKRIVEWLSIEWDITLEIKNVFQEKWFWLEEWFCILSFSII
jgi:hypothetical protein